MTDEILEKFWDKVQVDEATGCWNWMAHKTVDGYGTVKVNEIQWRASRFAYEVNKDKIPEGLQLDHLCRNRGCINPEHVEPVSPKINVNRGIMTLRNKSKTHCPQGHLYEGSNLIIDQKGWRYCKECKRINDRIYYQNNKEKFKLYSQNHRQVINERRRKRNQKKKESDE